MKIMLVDKPDNSPAPPQEESDQAQCAEKKYRAYKCGIHTMISLKIYDSELYIFSRNNENGFCLD
jgi:hypothetical protein